MNMRLGAKQNRETNMAKQIKDFAAAIIRLRPYVLAHLAEECQAFANIRSDLVELQTHPGRSPHILGKEELEKLSDEKLIYIEKIIGELRTN
jgi:uncharacterized membrane-anchored protein YhcB (DUF1043 family)